MDKVQKHSDSECYIPSSEPFRICISFVFENVTHDISNNDRRNACVTRLNLSMSIYIVLNWTAQYLSQQMLELIFIFQIALQQNVLEKL